MISRWDVKKINHDDHDTRSRHTGFIGGPLIMSNTVYVSNFSNVVEKYLVKVTGIVQLINVRRS